MMPHVVEIHDGVLYAGNTFLTMAPNFLSGDCTPTFLATPPSSCLIRGTFKLLATN